MSAHAANCKASSCAFSCNKSLLFIFRFLVKLVLGNSRLSQGDVFYSAGHAARFKTVEEARNVYLTARNSIWPGLAALETGICTN